MPFAVISLSRSVEPAPGKTRRGFTLVELIVVMGIMSVLLVLLGPPVSSLLRAAQLAQAREAVVSTLSLARQTALAQNRSVEVRIYQYADPANAGEVAGNASSGKFRALQLFKPSDTGANSVALGAVALLPQSVIFDSSATLSTLLGLTRFPATSMANPYPISRAQTSYNYVSFHFQAGGSTDLPSTSGLSYLTMHNAAYGDPLSQPPADYATVQIDPINGKITTYRP